MATLCVVPESNGKNLCSIIYFYESGWNLTSINQKWSKNSIFFNDFKKHINCHMFFINVFNESTRNAIILTKHYNKWKSLIKIMLKTLYIVLCLYIYMNLMHQPNVWQVPKIFNSIKLIKKFRFGLLSRFLD